MILPLTHFISNHQLGLYFWSTWSVRSSASLHPIWKLSNVEIDYSRQFKI